MASIVLLRSVYHVESLIRKLSGLVTCGRVYTTALFIVLGCPLNSGDGLVQFITHCSIYNWLANVVTQIKGSDEQAVNPRHFGDCFHLDSEWSTQGTTDRNGAQNIFQGSLCLDLHNGDQ